MSMGLRKGPILPISQTNHPYKSPVIFRVSKWGHV